MSHASARASFLFYSCGHAALIKYGLCGVARLDAERLAVMLAGMKPLLSCIIIPGPHNKRGKTAN